SPAPQPARMVAARAGASSALRPARLQRLKLGQRTLVGSKLAAAGLRRTLTLPSPAAAGEGCTDCGTATSSAGAGAGGGAVGGAFAGVELGELLGEGG